MLTFGQMKQWTGAMMLLVLQGEEPRSHLHRMKPHTAVKSKNRCSKTVSYPLKFLPSVQYPLLPRTRKKKKESTSTRMSSRRRPLHTCGVSFIAISEKACTRAQDINGPLGSATRKVSKIASPITPLVHALLYQWLAILSSLDDRMLGVENVVEAVFPPAGYMFNKIDGLVRIAETLPGYFDDAVSRFPAMIHGVPVLEWVLVRIISWLNSWISVLAHWGSGTTKEKEIVVDVSYEERIDGKEVDNVIEPQRQHDGKDNMKVGFDPMSVSPGSENRTLCQPVGKGTYKDALLEDLTGEKFYKSCASKEENNRKEMTSHSEHYSQEEDTTEGWNGEEEETDAGNEATVEEDDAEEIHVQESTSKDDPILDLFETAWLMKPGRKKGNNDIVPRSVSYKW